MNVGNQALEAMPAETMGNYLGDSSFWLGSFQNWQSECLSVFAIIFLSIYLHEIRSPQSRTVDASHVETGE